MSRKFKKGYFVQGHLLPKAASLTSNSNASSRGAMNPAALTLKKKAMSFKN